MAPPSQVAAEPPQIQADAVPADVDLILLFGSRAKGTHAPSSDWDIGICFQQDPDQPLRLFELDALIAPLLGCSSDNIDLVDLEHSSYLLQRVVAEDGRTLFERHPGLTSTTAPGRFANGRTGAGGSRSSHASGRL